MSTTNTALEVAGASKSETQPDGTVKTFIFDGQIWWFEGASEPVVRMTKRQRAASDRDYRKFWNGRVARERATQSKSVAHKPVTGSAGSGGGNGFWTGN